MAESFKEGIQRRSLNPLEARLAELGVDPVGDEVAAPAAVVEEPQVVEEKIGLGVPAHGSVEAAEIAQLKRKLKQIKNPKFHPPLIERIAEIQAAVAAAQAAAADDE